MTAIARRVQTLSGTKSDISGPRLGAQPIHVRSYCLERLAPLLLTNWPELVLRWTVLLPCFFVDSFAPVLLTNSPELALRWTDLPLRRLASAFSRSFDASSRDRGLYFPTAIPALLVDAPTFSLLGFLFCLCDDIYYSKNNLIIAVVGEI